MKVYVCGDTHAGYAGDLSKLNTSNWSEQKTLCKDDLLIILGDFGLIWEAILSKEEKYWLDWLSQKRCTIAFIDGNHENFDRLSTYPRELKWGGLTSLVHDNVYHLHRGQVFTFGNKKVLTMGGAESIDKHMRMEFISWWKQESITQNNYDNCLYNLEKVGYSVDYVLSHTCPTFIGGLMDNVFKQHKQWSMDVLDNIEKRLEDRYKAWFFAHYHIDEQITDKFFCHYNGVPRRII